MPRLRVSGEMTTTIVARELGIGRNQLTRWVDRGALLAPTRRDHNGVRYFNQDWLDRARQGSGIQID